MDHACKENDTIGTLGENLVYFDDGQWWLSVDCGCCHTEINFCPFCSKNLKLQQIIDEIDDEFKDYKGVLKSEKSYDKRTIEHFNNEVRVMKREVVLEMIESAKDGSGMFHPEYLRMLINRNFIKGESK